MIITILNNIIRLFKKKQKAEYYFALHIHNNAQETKKRTTLHKLQNDYLARIKIKTILSVNKDIIIKHCEYESPAHLCPRKCEEQIAFGFKYAYECMNLEQGLCIFVDKAYFGFQDAKDGSFLAYCAVQVLWKACNYVPLIEQKVMFDLEKRKFYFPNDIEKEIYIPY